MFVTNLDMLVFVAMLGGGIIGILRGFVREILDLAGIGVAAAFAFIMINQPSLVEFARTSLDRADVEVLRVGHMPELAVGATTFLVVLAAMWYASKIISDLVTNDAVSAFNRSLGLLFGAGKGFMIVVFYLVVNATAFETLFPWKLKRDNYSYPYVTAAGKALVDIALPYLPAHIAPLAARVRL